MPKVVKAVGGLLADVAGKTTTELGEKSISASGRRFSKEAIDTIMASKGRSVLGKSKDASEFFDKNPIPVQDLPAIKYLAETGDTRFDNLKAAYDGGVTPVMINITDEVNKELSDKAQKAAVLKATNPQVEKIANNFTVSEKNLAPGIVGADLASEISEASRIHEEFKAIQQSGKRLGEKELSIGSTIGSSGQKKSFNLSPLEKAETVPRAVGGTNIKEIPGQRGVRREISAEIENMPYKELHHIFGKSPGEKIISNVWKLIDEGKATVDDLVNLNYWAKHYSVGMGDFGAEAVNRVPHSRTHSRSRAFKREMSAKEIKAIPEFDNIDDLTSYFRETLETRTIPMRGELDIQQGIYDQLPKKTRIEVEQLKVAKEKASRELTDRYKKIYGETMPETPPEVKDGYQTHIWLQKDLNVTDSKLIDFAEKLDEARLAQDMQMTRVATQLEQLEAEELASLDRRAIKTGRPGKQTSARAQQKIDYSQVRDETDTYEMLTGKEDFWKSK